MIKQFSLVIFAALMLSACGGSDDDFCCEGKLNKSSVASSPDDSSSSSSAPSASMSFGFAEGIDGWYINGSAAGTTVTADMELAHDITNAGMEIKPLDWTQHATSNWIYQARWDFEDAPLDLSDSHISVTASIPQSYVDDGALTFQLIIHHTDSNNTDYGANINVADLATNDDGDYLIERDINVDSAVAMGIQITTPPSDASIKDTILVKGVLITLPADSGSGGSSSSAASGTSIDFESDTVGTTYPAASWAAEDLTATVVAISSVTAGDGLPANGSSVNVLQIKPTNYNAVPLFDITLPNGKTLADYTVQVDAYFPHNSLGLAEDGNNGFKEFFLLAGETVSSGANADNGAYQSTYNTGAADLDAWKTFELSVDATKGALLTGNIQIALGISRPAAGAGVSDEYYFDNIKLIEK